VRIERMIESRLRLSALEAGRVLTFERRKHEKSKETEACHSR